MIGLIDHGEWLHHTDTPGCANRTWLVRFRDLSGNGSPRCTDTQASCNLRMKKFSARTSNRHAIDCGLIAFASPINGTGVALEEARTA